MKKTKKAFALILTVIMLLSVMTVCASATKPVISTSNRWFTACFNYNIRATPSNSGTVVQLVNKSYNRYSGGTTSGSYVYTPNTNPTWVSMYNATQTTLGYARSDLVCPKDRCYKVNAASGLNIRESYTTGSDLVCTVSNGTYLEVINVMSSTPWCQVRVRTGDYEGKVGYVAYQYIVQVNNHANPYET